MMVRMHALGRQAPTGSVSYAYCLALSLVYRGLLHGLWICHW